MRMHQRLFAVCCCDISKQSIDSNLSVRSQVWVTGGEQIWYSSTAAQDITRIRRRMIRCCCNENIVQRVYQLRSSLHGVEGVFRKKKAGVGVPRDKRPLSVSLGPSYHTPEWPKEREKRLS